VEAGAVRDFGDTGVAQAGMVGDATQCQTVIHSGNDCGSELFVSSSFGVSRCP